jgi:hypothetical protein
LKRFVGVVARGEIAAKGEVLFHLRGSEPKNFSQVGNHALRISLRCCEGNPAAVPRAVAEFKEGYPKMVVC